MIDLFVSSAVFILGLMIGSFLNCVVYRLERDQSFLKGRSFCPRCNHQLGCWDLIPILSFLFLRGECRYCKKGVSWQYPLVELTTGVLFMLLLWHFHLGIDLIFGFLISGFLIIIFIYDLKHYLIPDKVIYPAILVSGIWYLVSSIFLNFYTKYEILNVIYAAFGAAAFFLLIVLVTRGRGMGVGDIKLAFLMGLILGWPNILVALFLAFMAGAIIGVGLIMARKKSFKSEVPFGPFLAAGTIVAMLYGQELINWYLSLL